MDLRQRNTGGEDNIFDGGGVRDGPARFGVERFDKDPHASFGDSRTHKSPRVRQTEEPAFDPDSSRDQELAQFQNALLPLIGGHEIW